MRINGFNKTTLLDYPGHIASTIFLGGCDFLCPFCHNASLVLWPAKQQVIPEEDIFQYLNKRKGIVEGVCITGGEPTLYLGLSKFIDKIKELGFLVKLDTNGNHPKELMELVNHHQIDFVAMDIKNSPDKYSISTGIRGFDISRVSESIEFLKDSSIPYEFRTTVLKEHHKEDDFIAIGKWIQGANAYYLQAYKDSGDIISPGFTSYTKNELMNFQSILLPFVKTVGIRGID
jgi:pyruvate formate lyase activating enzyme